MNLLDMRTLVFGYVVTSTICVGIIVLLWRQSRGRFKGIDLLVIDFIFQASALILVVLRGAIPDWISIVLSNTLVVAGAILGFMGQEHFVEKKGPQIHNYLLLTLFVFVHSYFAFVQPSLAVRNINIASALLLVCFQCVWLMWHRVEPGMRSITFGVGLVNLLYCLISVVRITHFFIAPHVDNNYFQPVLFEALVLVSYQVLFILLTYSLVLMVNKRLFVQVGTQEEKFALAFHSAPYAITITRPSDGKIMEVNESFFSITGYDRTEAVGKNTKDLHLWAHDEDRTTVVDALLKTGKVQGKEFSFRRKNGEAITGIFSAQLLTIDGEKSILSSIGDITERKQAEEALQKSEAKLRAILDATPFPIALVDAEDNNIVLWSRSALDIFGHTAPTAQEWYQIAYPDPDYRREVIERWKPVLEIARKSGKTVNTGEYRITCRNGSVLICELYATFLKTGLLVTFNDITDRKKAEETLQQSEENFRRSLDDSPLGERIVTHEGETLYANRALLDLYGYDSVKELQTTSTEKRYTPESYAEFRIRREKRRQGVHGSPQYEVGIIRRTGEVRHLQVLRREILWDGKLCDQTIYQDITERKRVERRDLLVRDVLTLLNRAEEEVDMIGKILLTVQKSHGFEAVGIRLKKGDDFPYFWTYGFPDRFVKAENYLCVRNREGEIVYDEQGNPELECMCGNIIRRRTDATLPFFTEKGSFWTNSTTDLLASTTEKDRQARTRNRCNAEGYESVAMIPLYSGDEIIGLLQINDRRRNQFTLDIISFLEGLGSSIGIVLSRNQRTAELVRSDNEKAVLLKEIHHRVKNNLQIIASLINMQSRQAGDEKLEEMFKECQDRIRAMASIHTLLYRSQNFAEIDFGEYIHETASQVLRSYQKSSATISLNIHAENVMLPIDAAIPCGLIINELITNAVKYAFPGDRQGEIKIEMGKTEKGMRLLFADNGVGLPPEIDFRNTETMGLKLVNMLVEQLDGTIEQVTNGGTGYLIVFKPQSVSEEVQHAKP